MASNRHPHMPEDLLMEILTRLPVKSLLRFKSVCKHWHSLIKSPCFISKHLHYQKSKNNGRLFLQHFNGDTQQYGYALFPDKTLASGAYHDLDYINSYSMLPGGSVHFEGPINGLFCLFNENDRIIMWNPAMREFKTLPFAHHPNVPPYFSCFGGAIGFGLDPLTEDYKVVLIQSFSDYIKKSSHDGNYAMVYTMRTNTWRHFDSLPLDCCLPSSRGGTYSKGVYHWWVDHRVGVLAFDMSKEVFRETLGPLGVYRKC